MVRGIDSFRDWFQGYEDQYAIIGGTACDLLMADALSSFSADIRFEADGFVSSASVFSRVSVRLSGELYWSPYCFDSRAFSFVLPGEPWYNTDRFRPVRRNEGEEP